MLELEVLIGELLTVDGATASTLLSHCQFQLLSTVLLRLCRMYALILKTYVAASEVTALKHELRNDTVEARANIAGALVAVGAENAEVLGRLGDNIVEELEVDAAGLGCSVKQVLASNPSIERQI